MPKKKSIGNIKKHVEKIGVLLMIEGFDEHYKFDGLVGFFDHLFPAFPKGFFAGGPLEGKTCYTLIHYANHGEAETCGVVEGTPIDAFGNEYKGAYSVHSLLSHLPPDDLSASFCIDCYPDLLPAVILSVGHSTVAPLTSEEILGPHVDDPNGSGIGIADFIEMAGFKFMKQYFHLPNKKIPSTRQYLEFLYGNDIPAHFGYSPSTSNLTNIKHELQLVMPHHNFVFRIGSETYRRNRDPYGNPKKIAHSTETAIHELIHEEGVDRIVVVPNSVIGANIVCYGPEWYDKNGQGISAIPGKTFKECVEDLTNGLGPKTQQDLDEYLINKPWDMHNAPFSEVKLIVEQTDPTVKLTFARPLAEFEGFEWAVLDILNYTIDKYRIPREASLRVVLAEHGMSGGWKNALECDCYFRNTSDLFRRLIARIESNFSWSGKWEVVYGGNECCEAEHDPISEDKPFGDKWSVGERIDTGINGQYVNELGRTVDNGTDNFDYIIIIPIFSMTDVFDTLVQLRLTLGNNIYDRTTGIYKRDENDVRGVPHYDAENFDDEYFTLKVFNATDCPSVPGRMDSSEHEANNPRIYKGSSTNPTAVIITGTFLSFGNSPVRNHLTEAGVKAIIETIQEKEMITGEVLHD